LTVLDRAVSPVESSLYDVQAQTRRILLEKRDGKPDHLLKLSPTLLLTPSVE
jgi:hypothetical protein